MRIITKFILLTSLLISSGCFAQEPAPFNAVQRLFSSMASLDYDEMAAIGTDDFHLLEVGEVWDMNDLISAIKSVPTKFERRNYFSVIKTKTSKDTVWVSYWNKADYTFETGEKIQSRWLESAVMVKVGTEWKIQMLHSTKLRPEQSIPEDVIFAEYTD